MRRRLGAGRSAGRGGGLTHAAWQGITSKCFTKCVTRPGPKLDDSEKICTAKCMDRRVSPVGVDAAQPSRRARPMGAQVSRRDGDRLADVGVEG